MRGLWLATVGRDGSLSHAVDARELRSASREVRGHALTLSLLGRYLARAHRGDVLRRSSVGFLEADAKVRGSATKQMLNRFVEWFGREESLALAILRVLGLFDRPAGA